MPHVGDHLRFRKLLTVQTNSDITLCSIGISYDNTGKCGKLVTYVWHYL